MPRRYQVKLTLKAADHLQGIFDYIQRNSPQNADRMTRRLLDGMDSLEHFPYRYRKLLRSKATFGVEIRSMPVLPYLIRYCIDDANQVVTVLSVRHGARRAGL
jgi:plasmid stabilization system protein ParE